VVSANLLPWGHGPISFAYYVTARPRRTSSGSRSDDSSIGRISGFPLRCFPCASQLGRKKPHAHDNGAIPPFNGLIPSNRLLAVWRAKTRLTARVSKRLSQLWDRCPGHNRCPVQAYLHKDFRHL
jgi:hypothetical protein